MSMLSIEMGRLRDRAKELRSLSEGLSAPYVVPSTKEIMFLAMQSAASELEQAADTIESLRERLQDDALRGECEMVPSGCIESGEFACTNCGAYNIGVFYDGESHVSMPRFCPSCGAKVRKAVKL